MPLEHPLLPGGTARATGRILLKDDRIALLMGKDPPRGIEDIPLHHPAAIELLKAESDLSWWKDHNDRFVTVRALWTGCALCLTQDGPSVEVVAEPRPTAKSTTTGAPTRSENRDPSPELQRAIYDLSMRGFLVSLWTDESASDGFIAWATATDVVSVRERLLPFYGASLQLVQSRWDSATLEQIRTVLRSAPSDILYSFGESHGVDHQPLLRATVKFLTTELAEALRDFPQDAFTLEVLIHSEP